MRTAILAALLALGAGCSSAESVRREALARAAAASAVGAHDRAAQILGEAAAYDPTDAAIATARARAHLAAGEPWEALEALQPLRSEDRSRPVIRLVEARALLARGRVSQALRVYAHPGIAALTEPQERSALLRRVARETEVDPRAVALPDAWIDELSAAYLREGKRGLALRWRAELPASIERERAVEPVLFAWLDAGAPREESAWVRPFAREDGSPGQRLAMRALCLQDGDTKHASAIEELFLLAFPDHPRRAGILLAMAGRARTANQPELALDLAREAARAEPGSLEALRIAALSLKALGRRDEARKALSLAHELAPGDPVIRGALADLSERDRGAGRISGGHFELSVEVRGDDPR